MTDVGLDRTVFKPHSVRGALATEYLRKGAPHAVTRQRGGWCTDRAFEQHYARTHQTADWEGYLLGVTCATSSTSERSSCPLGEPLEEASGRAELSLPLVPVPEPTEEGGRSGTEVLESEARTLLAAKGALRAIGDRTKCAVCKTKVGLEAGWMCTTCNRLVHVRCLSWSRQSDTEPSHTRSTKNEVIYEGECIDCRGLTSTALDVVLSH